MSATTDETSKKKLHELETTYKLHPRVGDVIVEGRDDARLLKWYLGHFFGPAVRVYAVDDRVIVPKELVEPVHRDINARGRVIALAAEAEKWDVPEHSLTCIIDADYDLFEDEVPQFSSLLRTDHAAMEVYTLQERPLSKFIGHVASAEIPASKLVSLLKPAWATVFAMRYALHTASDGASLVNNFANKCIRTSESLTVDPRELLRASHPTLKGEPLELFLQLYQKYFDRIPGTTLDGIRGHDIAPMLIRYFGLKNAMANNDTVEKLLRMSLELDDLDSSGLFQALKRRIEPLSLLS